jgi:hypothetical protein
LKTILYTKFFNEEIQQPVNIILSPEFYWIKKIDIPVKSLKDAKKIAKNSFKLNEKEYFFEALKINGEFFAVAIPKNIQIDIPQKFIRSIRIAQSEFYNFECIQIDENHFMKKIDGLLFCFPTGEENCIPLSEAINKITLSKYKFNLINRFEIDKFSLTAIVLIFLFINAAFILQGISYKKQSAEIYKRTVKILNENSLPQTTFQLDSIIENLKNKIKKQNEIRKKLKIISKTPLNKGEFFKKLSLNGNSFNLEIKTNKNLDFYFEKYFKLQNSSYKNGIYKASIQ